MGGLSELGPIDPQITGMPALAVKNSLEHLCEIVADHPTAKDMLSDYLAKSLPIEFLGYYERAAESAIQYAERLLGARIAVTTTPDKNTEIARKLVYDYKDHRFAIDAAEAISIFGEDVVIRNSSEYDLANRLYQMLDFLKFVVNSKFNRQLAYTGLVHKGAWVRKKPS